MYKTEELFDLNHTSASDFLRKFEYAYQAIAHIKEEILQLIKALDKSEYEELSPDVYVHKSAKVYPSSYIAGPAIIGENTQIRPGAFIRGSVLVGSSCVVGNSTELKNVILFDSVQVPHYNYVGDSILGYKAHMGAGSITSNVKSDKSLVVIHDGENEIATGLKKMGALIADYVEIGCNSVLNPGTVIARRSSVYPLSSVRGVIEEDSIYKDRDNIIKRV